jgi:phosphatidylserine/phosphatidylglycerophosphate/cardiolipin synthase-like enzyme
LLNDLEVVATGEKWIGNEVRSISSVIREIIDLTENYLLLTIYILSDVKLLKYIEKALEKGVYVDLYVYNPEKRIYGVTNELNTLESKYRRLKIFKIYNAVFHAKVLVSDGKRALIGSANLTRSAMLTNYEMGIMIKNPEIAFEIERVVRRFFE